MSKESTMVGPAEQQRYTKSIKDRYVAGVTKAAMTVEEAMIKDGEVNTAPIRDFDAEFTKETESLANPAPKLPEATAAKYGKTPIYNGVMVLFPRALQAVAKVSEFGAKKHKKAMGDDSYASVPDAANVYNESLVRHIVNEVIEGPVNVEDGRLLHKAQRAWNALADLEVYLRRTGWDVS